MSNFKRLLGMTILGTASPVLASDSDANGTGGLSDWWNAGRKSAQASALQDLRNRELAYTPFAAWASLTAGGSLYDLSRRIAMGRWAPDLSVGARMEKWGAYASLGWDILFDFSQEVTRLDVLRYGAGVEYLYMGGHLRSSLGAGFTTLLKATKIDPVGTPGYFFSTNFASLRWDTGWTPGLVFEFSPWNYQMLILSMSGIPLVVSNWVTNLTLEWSY